MEKVMKEITKDIICECAMFLGKVILIGTVICGTAYVGYNYWYVNHFTPEERMMIEEVQRKMDMKKEAEKENGKASQSKEASAVPKKPVGRVLTANKTEIYEPIDPNMHFYKCYHDIRNAYLSENRFVKIEFRDLELGIIAKTIYLEACGEGKEGMKAVASVIYNRMRERKLRGKAVCLEEGQFSCWNNRKKDFTTIRIEVNKEFLYCAELALDIVTRKFKPSLTANHYYNPSKCNPSWGRKMRKVCYIGRHKFGRV